MTRWIVRGIRYVGARGASGVRAECGQGAELEERGRCTNELLNKPIPLAFAPTPARGMGLGHRIL